MFKRFFSNNLLSKIQLIKRNPFHNSNFKRIDIFDRKFQKAISNFMILGVGVLAYFKGIDGFSKLSAYYTIQKESIEQKARADDDVRNCLERIRNFKLSEDYYERKNDPNYNTLNIESLLTKLKSRRTICLKGNYGSGTSEYSLAIAEKWLDDGNYVIYMKPHARLFAKGRSAELLKMLNAKEEESFLKALKILKKEKKEILLIADDLDCMDLKNRESFKFLKYLKNLQEDSYLNTLYVFRTNLFERFITGLYNNDISLVFVGGNKFLDMQTDKEKEFVSKYCNIDLILSQKFLFFFGMNFKNMKEYNDFVLYNQENNKDKKTLEDFIDAKIDKVIDSIENKGNTKDILNLCRTIDSDGILNSNWKKYLTSSQRSTLENNDFLVISGTTTALTRAAITKLCDKNWKNWDLEKWKGKWNIEYYL